MALTFTQVKTLLGNLIGDSGSAAEADIGKYVNLAARDVYHAHTWGDRLSRAMKLTTATATVTDAVVSALDTALTSAGNELDTGWVGRKITTSIGNEFGVFSAVASAGAATLESGWQGTALTGSTTTYVYDDRVALPADCRTLNRIQILDGTEAWDLDEWPRQMAHGYDLLPLSTGRPLYYRWDKEVSGTKYVQVGPYVPDQQYTLVIEYWKSYTDMSADGDTCDVPDERIDIVLQRALYWIYQRDHFQRAVAVNRLYREMLAEHIRMDKPSYPNTGRLGIRGKMIEPTGLSFRPRDLEIS